MIIYWYMYMYFTMSYLYLHVISMKTGVTLIFVKVTDEVETSRFALCMGVGG